jgi:hypothetical protein
VSYFKVFLHTSANNAGNQINFIGGVFKINTKSGLKEISGVKYFAETANCEFRLQSCSKEILNFWQKSNYPTSKFQSELNGSKKHDKNRHLV